MRFSYCDSMVDPGHYVALARAAELAGFDTFLVADSIVYPKHSATRYPYTADGDRTFLEDAPFIDPFVLIATLAAHTTSIRFATYVLKLPIRNPVLVAKQAASLAVMSGERLSLGVGLSPWPEDYEVCGTPWDGRGRRVEEQLDIVRGLMHGEGYFEYSGEHFEVPPVKICPQPQRSVPVLMGGNASTALRRAARCDGWMQGGVDDDALEARISTVLGLRRELGSSEGFEIHAGSSLQRTVGGVGRLEHVGVTDLVVVLGRLYRNGAPQPPLEGKLERIRRYGDEVIAAFR